MSNPVYIVDIIGEVFAAAETVILPDLIANETDAIGSSLIQTIDYQHGHKRELLETLFQMDGSKTERFKKYPLGYLVQDFTERRGRTVGIYTDVSLNLILAHHTKSEFKVEDRYNKVFKPVLYPLYYEILEQIAKHPLILESNADDIPHDKTDRSYWGRQAIGGTDANKLNDFVDAIEITNLNLKFYFKTC